MSKLFATAGSQVFIGTAAMAFAGVDLVQADFAGVSWTKIGGTTDIGRVGDAAQLVSSDQVESARTRKIKGTRNAGSQQLVCDLDYSDPGQIALVAAEKTAHSYPIRMVFNDAPAGGTPSERLYIAYVLTAEEQLGGPNNVMQLQATLEIDSNIVRISAAA